jgi:hypothetical protein
VGRDGAVSQHKISERLLAHARICRQIAAVSWNEEIARELEQLAGDCKRAADVFESFTPKSKIIPETDAQDGATVCATS